MHPPPHLSLRHYVYSGIHTLPLRVTLVTVGVTVMSSHAELATAGGPSRTSSPFNVLYINDMVNYRKLQKAAARTMEHRDRPGSTSMRAACGR